MAEKSPLFAAGRISVLEGKLLSRDRIENLITGSYENGRSVLREIGFGAEACNNEDIDQVIKGEQATIKSLVADLSSDPTITDMFFLASDISNLKYLIKMRLQGKETDTSLLDVNGLYEIPLLALMVKQWEFPELPGWLTNVLAQIDETIAETKNPQTASVMLDRAYYNYVRSSKSQLVREYFGTQCDIVNLVGFLRGLQLDLPVDEYKAMLMPEYNIAHSQLLQCYESKEIHSSLFARTTREFSGYLRQHLENKDPIALQRAGNDCLFALLREYRSDVETISRVIWYYFAKQREVRIVRLVLTLKKAGIGIDAIRERLGQLI